LGVNAGTNGWRIWAARLYQSFFWHSITWDVKPKLTLEVSNACWLWKANVKTFSLFKNLFFSLFLLLFALMLAVAGKQAMFGIFISI
jgi:hypothetical protein